MHTKSFPYIQQFDWEGFKGRLLSSSFIPREDAKNYNGMISELKNIFERYQKDEKIDFTYSTKLYYGHLN